MAKSEERKQFLLDVFTTACEGGINYWARCKKYHWMNKEDETDDLDGFYAVVEDAEISYGGDIEMEGTFPESKIDQAIIVKGINKIFKDDELKINQSIRADVIQASLKNDACYLDSESADCIVQVGLFGELVFG